MSEALAVSHVLLWIAVVALAFVVLALARQIGVLHERLAPVGALALGAGPKVGEAAPVFELADFGGRALRIGGADADGRATLLFFLSPSCPVCSSLLPHVGAIVRREDPRARIVLASDGPRAEHERFVAEVIRESAPYVLSTALGLAYRIGKLPYAVLLDARGVVRAQGLVNTREHLESLFEASARGVASIQEYVARAGGAREAGHG